MGAIANGLSMILAKVVAALKWLGMLVAACFTAGWDFIRDAATWIFEEALKLAVSAMSAIDVSGMSSAGQWWGSLPAEIMNMLGLVGFPIAMGIIMAAVAIRLVLQLIPFTRLGS
jgi:hypothetical protein